MEALRDAGAIDEAEDYDFEDIEPNLERLRNRLATSRPEILAIITRVMNEG